MSKRTILGDNTTRDCSEACSSTRLRLVQLQASEQVTCGIITQIAHLAMLLIMICMSLFILSIRLCQISQLRCYMAQLVHWYNIILNHDSIIYGYRKSIISYIIMLIATILL